MEYGLVHSMLCPPESPSDLFAAVATRPGVAFLDGRRGVARAPRSHVAWDSVRTLRVDAYGRARIDGAVAATDPLKAMDEFLAAESAAGRVVIGAVGYELRQRIEPSSGPLHRGELPIVSLSSYAHHHTFDHRRGAWLGAPPSVRRGERPFSFQASPPRPSLDAGAYAERFARVREWIAAGDVYQVNLAIAFEADLRGSAAALYERVARANPVPYGAYVDFVDFQVLSNSPELFLERRGARLATRPIKGTRPRGRTPGEDLRLATELATDPKERAEHVMIVDLERNDLGRISGTGTVAVEDLEAVETYATLRHLESTVRGVARPGLRFSDCLRAMFPGGSITGAPKIRAMQILAEIEPEPRGFYTGGVLHYPPDGDFTMSICIRTATVRNKRIRYVAGGGIVADSRPDAEYAECLLKARAFLAAAAVPEVG